MIGPKSVIASIGQPTRDALPRKQTCFSVERVSALCEERTSRHVSPQNNSDLRRIIPSLRVQPGCLNFLGCARNYPRSPDSLYSPSGAFKPLSDVCALRLIPNFKAVDSDWFFHVSVWAPCGQVLCVTRKIG